MHRVSIGVPVYNGAGLLRECLECLAAQTYTDFEVVVSDNGSTDGTADICAEMAARDPRFRHLRHETTQEVMANFLAARDATSGPLFMWRAFDDLAEPDYLARLVALHDAHPGLRLAVGSVRQEFGPAKADKLIVYPARDNGGRAARVIAQLFRGEASWFYGLWSRSAVEEALAAVRAVYPDPWGGDHLNIFHAAVRDGIRGDGKAIFRQCILPSIRGYVPRPKPTYAEIRDRNARFGRAARQLLDDAGADPVTARLLRLLIPFYVNKRCHRLLRVLQARIRQLRGR